MVHLSLVSLLLTADVGSSRQPPTHREVFGALHGAERELCCSEASSTPTSNLSATSLL